MKVWQLAGRSQLRLAKNLSIALTDYRYASDSESTSAEPPEKQRVEQSKSRRRFRPSSCTFRGATGGPVLSHKLKTVRSEPQQDRAVFRGQIKKTLVCWPTHTAPKGTTVVISHITQRTGDRVVRAANREIIKPSEHALGVYFFPDKRERYTPNHFKAKKYPCWIVEAWERILDLNEKSPSWLKYNAMRKLAITTPNVLRTLRSIDHEAARPYTFVISPVLALSNTVLVARFCDKPSLWDDLEYVSVDTGEKGKLGNWVQHIDGKLVPLVKQTMGDVIRNYGERPEFKSLGPDGSFCTKNTIGLLRRRPVIAKPISQLIGKEVDRGTSEDAFVAGGEQLMRYQSWGTETFPKALKKLSDREIARRTGLDAETVSRIRRRGTGRPETRAKLMKFARGCATSPVPGQCIMKKRPRFRRSRL
jgi:hypothetical protein